MTKGNKKTDKVTIENLRAHISQLEAEKEQWEPQWKSNAEANAAGYNEAVEKLALSDAAGFAKVCNELKKANEALRERVSVLENALRIEMKPLRVFQHTFAENALLREALEEIYTKSQDNWACARAESGLGRGKIAVMSRQEEKQNCAAPSTRDGEVAPQGSRPSAGGNPVSIEINEHRDLVNKCERCDSWRMSGDTAKAFFAGAKSTSRESKDE